MNLIDKDAVMTILTDEIDGAIESRGADTQLTRIIEKVEKMEATEDLHHEYAVGVDAYLAIRKERDEAVALVNTLAASLSDSMNHDDDDGCEHCLAIKAAQAFVERCK